VQVTVERIAPCRARVSFNVPSDEFEGEVRRALAELGRKAKLKGFRPGHVPPAVLERLHGREVRQEARHRFVRKAYEQAIGENDLRPLGQPSVELADADLLAGQDFSQAFEVTLRPEFELGAYKGLEVASRPIQIDDESLERGIEQLARSQAWPEPAGEEGLTDEGMTVCRLELLFEGQVVLTREGLRLGPGTPVPGVDADLFRAALQGAREGSVVELEVHFPEDFEHEPARGRTGICRLSIQQAFKIHVPTREELAKQLGLEGEPELRERVRERMLEAARAEDARRIEAELLERLVDAHSMELPEGMVESQAQARLDELRQSLAAQGVDEARVEEELSAQAEPARAAALRGAKGFFLIQAIAEKEGLQVTQDELRAELAAIAERNRASFDEVRDYYQEQELFPQLAMEIAERKVRTFLRESARISPGA
jgi:trigger factor